MIIPLLLAGCNNGKSPSTVAVNEILTVDQVRAIQTQQATLLEEWGISGSTAELLNNLTTRRLRQNLKITLESGPETLEQYIPLSCAVPPCSGPVTGLIRRPITLQ